jgi:hypothetical protein
MVFELDVPIKELRESADTSNRTELAGLKVRKLG